MSEVQELLEKINAEFIAARRALTDPAIMAPHDFIQKRMANMSVIHDTLQKMMPGEQATALVVQAMENAGKSLVLTPGEQV